MPYVLTFLRRKMNAHLSYGFDVGRGYVAGEEEVRKLIDHMVDHKDIAKSLKQISDNGRLDVIRCLGKSCLCSIILGKAIFFFNQKVFIFFQFYFDTKALLMCTHILCPSGKLNLCAN